jgi:Protein of unknown function (DUF551)
MKATKPFDAEELLLKCWLSELTKVQIFTHHDIIASIDPALHKAILSAINQAYQLGRDEDKWIDAVKQWPDIKKDGCSDNVLAIEDGELKIMCLAELKDDDNNWCTAWCNCYGDINGEGEFDEQYNPTHWQPLPQLPSIPGNQKCEK